MTYATIRSTLGLFILLSHFIIVILVVVYAGADKFTPDELFPLLAVIAPPLAVYSTAILKEFLAPMKSVSRRRVPLPNAVAMVTPPVLLLSFTLGVLSWKAFGNLGFENLLKLIATSQTVFGVYVGMIVRSLFPTAEQ